VQGDITSQRTVDEVLAIFRQGDEARLADLVVCDGAPDVTGMHDLDEYIQAQLLLAAISITTQLLREGGTFVAKIFRGKDSSLLYSQLKIFFPDVCVAKPKSSRNSSVEAFVVAQGFAPPDNFSRNALSKLALHDYSAELPQHGEGMLVVPFVACGDLSGYDADQNYALKPLDELLPGSEGSADTPIEGGGAGREYVYRESVQKPTTPAYRAYLEAQGGARSRTLDDKFASTAAAAPPQGPG